MKSLAVLAAAITLSLTIGVGDAEAAKRLGSGKSSGFQREMTPPAKAPMAAPAANPSAPTAAAAAKAPAAAAPQAGRSWMGPVAGLAAGLGLAALASHFGFGEELASFMMMALLAVVVMAAVGFFLRKRAAGQQPALAGAGAGGGQGNFNYAASRAEPATTMARSNDGMASGSGSEPVTQTTGNIPADFDVAGFVRNAKVHYIRLQAANDAGNLDDIREFTTPEMFAEIRLSIGERGTQSQVTDVVAIEAEVIDVTDEPTRHVVSVRYTGQIREDNGPVESVDEIWHLVKPRSGQGGWVLAGIQQIQ